MGFHVARCYVCNKPIFKGPIPFDDDGEYHQSCFDKYLEFLEPGRNLKEIRDYIEQERENNEVPVETDNLRLFSVDGWV